jgi:DNA-binding MurR/RpiR family transcriptional regulator
VEELIDKTFRYAMRALEETAAVLNPVAVEKGAEVLLRSKRVVLAGVGGSGAAAAMAVQRLLRLGIHVHVCSDLSSMPLVAGTLTPEDVALGVSHGGYNEPVEEFLDIAKRRGATTMAVCSNLQSPVAKASEIVLQSVCPESLMGPEAGSARVAQITVIDALCLAIAVKIKDR